MQNLFEEQLTFLLEKTRSILAIRDIESLSQLIIESFLEISGIESGCFFLQDVKTGKWVSRCGVPNKNIFSSSNKYIKPILQNICKNKEIILATSSNNTNLSVDRAIEDLDLNMIYAVPLFYDSYIHGIFYSHSQNTIPEKLKQIDMRVCKILSENFAIAIDNVRMFENASNDPLTGLPNNNYFIEQINKFMKEATESQSIGILFLDIDDFKRVNVVAGTEMGDRALIDIAHTLEDLLRSDGLVVRYRSDKFAVFLPPDPVRISLRLRDVAERSRALIATKMYHGIPMTISIGGTSYPSKDVKQAYDLISIADALLVKARKRGFGEIEINA